MSVTLYDLIGKEQKNFSPWCWPVRMALCHKNVEFNTVFVKFTQIEECFQGRFRTLPVIKHNDRFIADSLDIAIYLDTHFQDSPLLFASQNEKNYALFMKNFCASCLASSMSRLIVYDIYQSVCDEDKEYFRQSREKYFGMPLQDIQNKYRSENFLQDGFCKNVRPIVMTLKQHSFLGGEAPSFLDYQIFGMFKWADMCSDYIMPALDEKLKDWYERLKKLYDAE